MPVTASNPFKWRHTWGHHSPVCAVALRFPISFAHMAEMALERGPPDQRTGPISVPSCGSTGQNIDFLLTANRDAAAAKRFFRKILLEPANPQPRVTNVDKNHA